jgi:glycosyltransferase involved in cell wall biosynthesis
MQIDELVSIIIPTYKMGAYIGEALASVGAQSYTSWEVIVVDDCGPDDGTKAAVESFASLHHERRVKFIRLAENKGVSGARNAAVAAAAGEWLAFLDPDDLWLEGHLRRHMEVRTPTDKFMVTASRVGVFRDRANQVVEADWGYSAWEQQVFPLSLALRNAMNPSAVVAPKILVDQVGGFDENRALQHTEDWDLWLKLVDAGAKFHFVNERTGLYRKHTGAGTADRPLMRRRLQAFAHKNADLLLPDLCLATFRLSQRVESLESRLNWLQHNPAIRILSFLQRFIAGGKPR